MLWKAVLLVFGVFACATAVIMIKACAVQPGMLAAFRLLLAAAVLSPVFLRDLRKYRKSYSLRHLLRTLLPGLMMGGHFVSWIIGARLTLAANASLIVNLVPVAMPFLLYALIKERLTKGEFAATALAMAGVAVLAGFDYRMSPQHFLGDVVCLGSMLLLAAYLALGRLNRDFPSVWLYVVPLYFFAGLLCLPAALLFDSPPEAYSLKDILLVVGLALVPTVMGHSIMNYCLRHIRGQAVSIAGLGQFIFAGIMAYFLLEEAPGWTFYAACAPVVGGAVLALRSAPKRPAAPEE